MEALTVLHWSRLSDLVGRKPVVLTGLFGLSLSMYAFGLSRTYWAAVVRFVSQKICLQAVSNVKSAAEAWTGLSTAISESLRV